MPLNGNRLREIRLSRGFTQEELSEFLDIGIRQIHRYESGETDPSGDVVSKIATLLGVTTDYLLGRVDLPTEYLTEDKLSPMERKLIAAVRRGLIVEALKTITRISEDVDQASIAPQKKAAHG